MFCLMNSHHFSMNCTYKELRQTLFAVEFEVADRMLNLSEGIWLELFFFLFIFESQYGDTGLQITEVIEQLLKLYKNLTERYRTCLHRHKEESKDNSFQQIVAIFDHAKARSLSPSIYDFEI